MVAKIRCHNPEAFSLPPPPSFLPSQWAEPSLMMIYFHVLFFSFFPFLLSLSLSLVLSFSFPFLSFFSFLFFFRPHWCCCIAAYPWRVSLAATRSPPLGFRPRATSDPTGLGHCLSASLIGRRPGHRSQRSVPTSPPPPHRRANSGPATRPRGHTLRTRRLYSLPCPALAPLSLPSSSLLPFPTRFPPVSFVPLLMLIRRLNNGHQP